VTVYRVDVTREYALTFYVEQTTLEAAKIDAAELVDGEFDRSDWTPGDLDISLRAARVPTDEPFWTGGPHGYWKDAK
jgi:hypothetical protein